MDNGMMIDLGILAVLVIGAAVGAKRGLWRSLTGAVLLLAAIFGASLLTNQLTAPATELIYPMVEEKAVAWAESAAEAAVDSAQQENAPDLGALREALEKFGVSQERLEELLASFNSSVGSAVSGAVNSLVSGAAKLFVRALVQTVLYLVCFVVLLLLLRLLIRAVDLMLKLPVLSTANSLGGAVFGLIAAALILFFVLSLCARFGVELPKMEQTTLFKWFRVNTPQSVLTSLL